VYNQQNVPSQYRGNQRTYQPVGLVQSQYGQSQSYGIGQSASSFHTANYRGNQPGHDNYLRADSTNPSSSSAFGASGFSAGGFGGQSAIGQSQQYGSAQSFHTANYRGNQPGHDNYLRADSTNPSSSSAFGASGFSGQSAIGQSQYGSAQSFHTANYRGNQPGHDNYLRADSTNPSSSSAFGASGFSSGGFSGVSSAGQSQYGGSSQSFHTANYRGNQPGHDNYLRADSTNPSSSSFGGQTGASFNRF